MLWLILLTMMTAFAESGDRLVVKMRGHGLPKLHPEDLGGP